MIEILHMLTLSKSFPSEVISWLSWILATTATSSSSVRARTSRFTGTGNAILRRVTEGFKEECSIFWHSVISPPGLPSSEPSWRKVWTKPYDTILFILNTYSIYILLFLHLSIQISQRKTMKAAKSPDKSKLFGNMKCSSPSFSIPSSRAEADILSRDANSFLLGFVIIPDWGIIIINVLLLMLFQLTWCRRRMWVLILSLQADTLL